VTWGIHLSFHCPELIEFFGLLGFQWLVLDAEHQPLSHERCRDLVRAADGVGMPCLVRVPRVQPSVIEGFLDAGVNGILAPHVESAEQARTLVAAVKSGPESQRRMADRSCASDYGLTRHPADQRAWANQNTFTAALIESVRGLEALESIMAVAGLDCVAIGPNDLGLSLGIHTGMADSQVRARVREAEKRIESYGKPRLTVVTDADQARAARAGGARLIAVSDAALLRTAGCLFLESAP
jgi:2-keto-3-deoxy-L-rhamnonate aldolase RhmA